MVQRSPIKNVYNRFDRKLISVLSLKATSGQIKVGGGRPIGSG